MRFLNTCWLGCLVGLGLVCEAGAQTNEYRAYWVDAFGAGFRSSSEVTTLVSDLRAGNFNAVFVEVRKRGDAYYTPNTSYPDYEPKATDMAAGFDSLADLIAKAHDTTGGKPRLEVHAWLVTYPIWNSPTAPASAQHPFNRHPEWLSRTDTGTTFDGNYYLDPGHPGVLQHTYTIALDLLTRYDVDGINFDYVRYMGREWGYNATSVARFNALYGRTGTPAQADSQWMQFRRDQVTALVRKIWLNARASRPTAKISADTITWAPGPTDLASWLASSGAYTDVLQDWRGWMEEGVLDLNIPMAYFDQAGSYTRDWTNWNNFAKDNQYRRQALIGPGSYLNWASNSITQLRHARNASPAGNVARGLCLYSYRVPFKGAFTNISRAAFHAALTTNGTSSLDRVAPGVFSQPATIPAMPWKSAATNGHLMGYLFAGSTNQPLDGARMTISGPQARSQMADAAGFYGFVDLPPGDYVLTATHTNQLFARTNVHVSADLVARMDLPLARPATNDLQPPVISGLCLTNLGAYAVTVLWTTDEAANSTVEYGVGVLTRTNTDPALVTQHSVALAGLAANTPWSLRVLSSDASTNRAVSVTTNFTTATAGTVADVIVDDAVALTVGNWTVSSSFPGYWGSGYRYASPGTGGKYVEFRPELPLGGSYRVHAWYIASAVGGNRTTNAQHLIATATGTQTIGVNQEANGQQWFPLGQFDFEAGTNSSVRVTDVMPEPSGNVVVADAMRWEFVPPPGIAPLVTDSPHSVTVFEGQAVEFECTATGTLPLSYQWQFHGTNLPGATGASLLREAATLADAGPYAVIVTNSGGLTLSSAATLTVLVPQPGVFNLVTVFTNGSVRLGIVGSAGATYRLEMSTNLLHWLPLTTLQTTNGTAVFLDTPAPGDTRRFYRTRP